MGSRDDRFRSIGAAPPPAPKPAARSLPPPDDDGGPRGGGFPGDPRSMTPELQLSLEALFTHQRLTVRQFREPLEMLVGWQQANRYEVSGEDGRPILWAAQEGSGVLEGLSRNFNPFHRNTTSCLTPLGTVALKVTFPFTFLLRRGEVLAWNGRPMGQTVQRFNLVRTRIDVVGTTGAVLLEIAGPALKFFSFTDWEFTVRQRGTPVAVVRKHWGGFFREAFTQADTFTIEFLAGFTDPRLRQLLLAAALTLDLVKFEREGHRLSGNDLIQRLLE